MPDNQAADLKSLLEEMRAMQSHVAHLATRLDEIDQRQRDAEMARQARDIQEQNDRLGRLEQLVSDNSDSIAQLVADNGRLARPVESPEARQMRMDGLSEREIQRWTRSQAVYPPRAARLLGRNQREFAGNRSASHGGIEETIRRPFGRD
jgi:septal ring factor EnvC (AmiA/AmiB activator)